MTARPKRPRSRAGKRSSAQSFAKREAAGWRTAIWKTCTEFAGTGRKAFTDIDQTINQTARELMDGRKRGK